jgi:tetratricopeptide (TPR) repeat protein
MNVWTWVNRRLRELRRDGHHRLATLMDELSTHVVEMRHAQVDALFPEALALARATEDPWIELFVRHWNLQSLVLCRMYGERALSEAVSLVDFSHRPETEGCPQSVCSVQDLAACYGIVDGPGFADERLEVTTETLARIHPGWSCFECISGEHRSALADAGRFEEGYAFLERQTAAALAHGPIDEPERFLGIARIRSLLDLGRAEEALAAARAQLAGPPDSKGRVIDRRTLASLALARLGHFEESAHELPAFDELGPDNYEDWAQTCVLLVRGGARANDPALGRSLASMTDTLDRNGAVRATLHVAQIHAELALARGAIWTARRALARMESLVPRLRRALDALDRVRAVRSAIERADAAPRDGLSLPDSPDALLAAIRPTPDTSVNAERVLPDLEAAVARWPDHEDLALWYARALIAAGEPEESRVFLEQRLRAREPTEQVVLHLARALLSEPSARMDALQTLIEERTTDPWIRAVPHFVRAVRAVEREQWDEAIALCRRVLAARPDAVTTRALLARALVRTGTVDAAREALDVLDAHEAIHPLDRPSLWQRVVAATILGRWAIARSAANAIGFEFSPGDAPIDERWELCRIRLVREESTDDLVAIRTGPVTARIHAVAEIDDRCVFGDEWVFDPRPVNALPPDATDEQKQEHLWLYPAVHPVKQGGYRSFVLEGARLDADVVDALRARLADASVELRAYEMDYTLQDPLAPEQTVPAGYFVVAAPTIVSDRDLAARLADVTRDLPRPFEWFNLAVAIGDADMIAAQRARCASYGIDRDEDPPSEE